MLRNVSEHCTALLSNSRCARLPFHNLQHTREVVESAAHIARHSGFSEYEIEPILIAAWFHDTGFDQAYKGHEQLSKAHALNFLQKQGYDPGKIEIVLSCIQATQMPQQPTDPYGEVLADADLSHICTPNFFYRKLLLRREWELELGKTYTDKEWHELNRAFLETNQFFTAFCQADEGRNLNLEKVNSILDYY